jgi:drug/metabolite transporter (DMT)-like permease
MTNRQKGVLALLATVAIWATPTIFVKYLTPYYDAWTQNALRYMSGAALIVPIALWRMRQQGVRLTKSQLKKLWWPALPNVGQQISWVYAMYFVFPALAAFLNKSSILFASVLAYALFPEERWLFRSKQFIAGASLMLAGTVGLAILRPDLRNAEVNAAVLLIVFAAMMWATYSVAVKKYTEDIGSTVAFGVVGVYSTLILAVLMWIFGDVSQWQRAPWHVNAILIASGMLCIGLGHTLYFYAIRQLGVTVCASMLLATPLGTLALSRLIFGEKLTGGQLFSAAVLLGGAALTILVREKRTPQELVTAVGGGEK